MSLVVEVEDSELRDRSRAGSDPVKRRQILDGAHRVFTRLGFDAASMNDITREAGVSKGTLYVYFDNKERLFAALIEKEREKYAQGLFAAIAEELDEAQALQAFGVQLCRLLCEDWVLRAQRIVLGIVERMPDIGREFFDQGPMRSARHLAAWLDGRVAAGVFVIDDTFFAAVQFLELSQATIVRPRLYRAILDPPTEAEIERKVRSAVSMFLRMYRPDRPD